MIEKITTLKLGKQDPLPIVLDEDRGIEGWCDSHWDGPAHNRVVVRGLIYTTLRFMCSTDYPVFSMLQNCHWEENIILITEKYIHKYEECYIEQMHVADTVRNTWEMGRFVSLPPLESIVLFSFACVNEEVIRYE